MIVTAHQPHFAPWLGYINRIHLADVFAIMDNMEYTHNHNINSNRIVTKFSALKVAIPVKYKGASKALIKDIEVNYNTDWIRKITRSMIHNYYSGNGFHAFYPTIEKILLKRHKYLFDLDLEILQSILDYLEIDTKIVIASEYNLGGNKEQELFISLMEGTNCDTILLGLGASRSYIHGDELMSKGFQIAGHVFTDPVYKQKTSFRLNGVSCLDMIFNEERKNSIHKIKNAGSYVYREKV